MKIDRKEFIFRTFRLLFGTWVLFIPNGIRTVFSDSVPQNQENQMSQKTKFLHSWILNLMNNMDKNLKEEEKINLLEDCGRACARNHAQKEAAKFQGNLDGWLSTMRKWVGAKNVKREKNTVQIAYSKCFCPLVQDIPPLLSETYCNCSRGWLKEVFETVMGDPVEVQLEDSIMQGGNQCRFSILL